jgi:HK97 family phage prohead protease
VNVDELLRDGSKTQLQRAIFDVQAQKTAGADGSTTIGLYAVGYGVLNAFSRVFVPGAFKESLEQDFSAEKPLPIGWMHEIPIGKFTTLRDDQRGPYLEGPISKTSTGEDAAVLVQDGLTAASVGFKIADYDDVVFADPGETVTFSTPYGQFTSQIDDYVLYVVKAQLKECSLVLVGADDDSRVVAVQSLLAKAQKALPAIATEGADWESVAYSMALLMGGRGAAAFQELPDLEHHALYQKIAVGYAKYGNTPPAYSRRPDYKDVAFQHGEREIFADRYLRQSLRTVIAGAGGLDGALSVETREEAERAIQSLGALTRRDQEPETSPLTQALEGLREATATVKGITSNG